MIPIDLLEIQVVLALLATTTLFFVKDYNNYVDVISGLVATIFWWTSGLSVLTGIQTQDGAFGGVWMMWIFVGIGIVTALITYSRLVDVLQKRGNHVNMSFDYRI